MKKALLSSVILIVATLSFAQKGNDYLLSYQDASSGHELTGFKTKGGKIRIKAKYSHSYTDTFYTLAIVLKDGEWIGIDRNGKILLKPFIYDNGPDYVVEGLFRFVEKNKMGFADPAGRKVIPAKFDMVTPFADGIAEYTLGGHKEMEKGGEHWTWTGGTEKGFINRSGQQFKKVEELKDNTRDAWTSDNKHVLLNKEGKVIKRYGN
jgi:hypothetical protein